MSVLELAKDTGIYGLLIVLSTFSGSLAGVAILLLTRKRRYAWIVVRLACLPLLIGLVGAYMGYRDVEAVLAAMEQPEGGPVDLSDARRAGMRAVRNTALLGVVGAAPIAALGVLAFWRSTKSSISELAT